MNLNRLKLFLAILLTTIVTTTDISAQTDEEQIISDRPYFTQSPFTVPNKGMQFEMGYARTYTETSVRKTTNHFAPDMLLRYGLSDRFEFRLGWSIMHSITKRNYAGYSPSNPSSLTGSTDLLIGTKFSLTPNSFSGSNAALNLTIIAPNISSYYNTFRGNLALLYRFNLNGGTFLAGSSEVTMFSGSGTSKFLTQSIALNIAIDESLSFFIEPTILHALTDSRYPPPDRYILNGGLVTSSRKNLNYSLSFGKELDTNYITNYFASIGISYLRL